VAWLRERAPAREVVPGQVLARGLGEFGVRGEMLAVEPDGLLGAVDPGRVGVRIRRAGQARRCAADVDRIARDMAVEEVPFDLDALSDAGPPGGMVSWLADVTAAVRRTSPHRAAAGYRPAGCR
jgi:hypothetical protein